MAMHYFDSRLMIFILQIHLRKVCLGQDGGLVTNRQQAIALTN